VVVAISVACMHAGLGVGWHRCWLQQPTGSVAKSGQGTTVAQQHRLCGKSDSAAESSSGRQGVLSR
jgi:hypothetical protein